MNHLALEQRYQISDLHHAGHSRGQIAQQVGVHKSTISRELRRNSDGRNGAYRPELAQRKSEERQRAKPRKKRFTAPMQQYVVRKLKEDLSPEQIAGEARRKGVDCVCAERIYQYVWTDKKRGGRLYRHLRTKGKKYAKRGSLRGKRGQIPGRVDIDQRPEIVEQKQRIGDVEMDLVVGKYHKGALLTINDRATGMLKMGYVQSKEAAVVQAKAVELLSDWKALLHTVTTDNGKEFAYHNKISEELGVDCYFAKPYHSWERGANENLNGLVRQYFPKGMNFGRITEQRVNEVVDMLNQRPRKRFGFRSPQEVFQNATLNNEGVAFIT
ncbi:IS30 family transposase [Rhabdobacter roseus]|uniref:IS30 family transposase n=1 Tax=Rhabdobacter roseus TaxID=1655419 RepID=A0A840U4R4_9BACT|nr:IS30 family transposase [Rhabdobacter roseus]MBB5287080.1 IS30 family transposase [Rhabdobacter roseus]